MKFFTPKWLTINGSEVLLLREERKEVTQSQRISFQRMLLGRRYKGECGVMNFFSFISTVVFGYDSYIAPVILGEIWGARMGAARGDSTAGRLVVETACGRALEARRKGKGSRIYKYKTARESHCVGLFITCHRLARRPAHVVRTQS